MSTNDNGVYITISRLKQNVKENGREHARINRQRSSQKEHEKGKGRARERRRNTTEQFREVDLARARDLCFLYLLWENRAVDLSPPTRSVSCSSSSFAPGGETHLLPFSFYCSSPCYLWPSSGPLPFWCPGQSNAWILLVVHAQHMPYPAPPPSPDLFADGTSSSSSPDFLI